MPIFDYKIRTKAGSIKTGTQEAKTKEDLAHVFKLSGSSVISIEEKKNEIKGKKSFSFSRKVSLVDKMMFTKNLAVMIGAGLSLTRALDVLAAQAKSPKFQTIIKVVSSDIQKGETLGDSMSKHSSVFPDLYVNMVKVGETAGNLQDVLNSLAVQLKKDHEIIARVKGAMMYPGIILTAMFGIGFLMMTIVVPSLAATFEDLGGELPASTQFIINLSGFLRDYWYIAILIIVVTIFATTKILKTPQGKKALDALVLKLPVFKDISKKLNSARFSRILSTLIDAGVPIVDALEILSHTLTNYFFSASVLDAKKEIQKGKQLNETLGKYGTLYPPLVIQMVEVGEETGDLTNIMSQLAEFYEEEVDNVTRNLSTIIEPILMVVIGAGVGFFAISMITPMYSILDNI